MPAPRFRDHDTVHDVTLAEDGGLRLRIGDAVALVSIARDGSVRLRAGLAAPPADVSRALDFAPWRPAPSTPHELDDGGIGLDAAGPEGAAFVEIDRDPFALRVRDRSGALLASLSGLGFADDGAARLRLAAPLGHRYLGFGEKVGPLDKRGMRLRMRTRDVPVTPERDPLYVAIPFFLALRAASPLGDESLCTGIFLDAHAPSRFDVAASDRSVVEMQTDAGGIDLQIVPGPRPADVLRRFTARVGRTPVPPRWALGHHQSRWSYGSERAVRRLARTLRARGIPTDAVHLDIDHMDGYRVFTWDRRRFPDPARLARALRKDGLRLVAIVDPGVKIDRDWSVFRDGETRAAYCTQHDGSLPPHRVWPGDVALPDFQRADVRAWWGEQHRALLDAGVAGVWIDMNEPAGWQREIGLGRVFVPWRPQDLSRTEQAATDDATKRVPHEHVRNLYGLQHARATREGLERLAPGVRPFVLSRSGYAGIQRHAAIWTGDTFSRWPQLALSVRMLLGLSLSGVAFCGADIGGFAGSCTPELFARWLQVGALYPFARTHSMWGGRRQEAWRYGARVEAIAREALRLRMRLLPYLYDLFHESAATGAPIWRPLVWEFPDDAEATDVDDQFLIGRWLLVAPVLERGARARDVYLPRGTWISLDDGARFAGGRRLRVDAPLERIPIFARGGAVIPTQSPTLHTGERPAEPLVLEVFPGGDGEHVLHEDDGETTAYRTGGLATTELRVRDRAGGRLRLEIGARRGAHEVGPRPVRVVFHAAGEARIALLDAVPLFDEAGLPSARRVEDRFELRFEDDGGARSVEIEPAP